MNNKTFIITAIVLILIQIGICTWLYKNTPPVIERTDTITKIEFDTIETVRDTVITKFIPKVIKEIKRDTITKDTVLTKEQKTYTDTLCQDGDSIQLTTTISGYEASLDSISAKWSKQHITKTEYITVTNTIKKRDKINVGLQLGYGIGLKDKEFQPFVGLGLQYNF